MSFKQKQKELDKYDKEFANDIYSSMELFAKYPSDANKYFGHVMARIEERYHSRDKALRVEAVREIWSMVNPYTYHETLEKDELIKKQSALAEEYLKGLEVEK